MVKRGGVSQLQVSLFDFSSSDPVKTDWKASASYLSLVCPNDLKRKYKVFRKISNSFYCLGVLKH